MVFSRGFCAGHRLTFFKSFLIKFFILGFIGLRSNSAVIMSAMVIFIIACAYFALYLQTRDAMKSVNPLNFKIQSVPLELVQRKDDK